MRQKPVMRRPSSRKLTLALGLIVLAGLLVVFAGCAPRETILPEPEVAELKVAEPEVAVPAPPPAPTGPSVTLLPNQSGFIVSEVPNNPENWLAEFDAAVACLERQDYAGAVELLQQVIDHEPGVTAPYIDIALAYRELGQPEPAEEHLQKALELSPAHPVAGNTYGLLLRSGGRFAEARTVYEQVLAQFPDYGPVHRNLGILCDLYLNDLECALDQYERYSAVEPGDEQVRLWLADLHLRLGR